MPSPRHRAIIAAAGSGKTETVIDEALGIEHERVAIVTFTNENQRQIVARIERKMGYMPAHISVLGWFSLLINHGVRPYQSVLTGEIDQIRALNFIGKPFMYTPKSSTAYYLDSNNDLYRDKLADLACRLDDETGGKVTGRLASAYGHIYVDEFQDLVGYDLDFLERLMRSDSTLTLVGDPRQHTFATNNNPRNKKYRGAGMVKWVEERKALCRLEPRQESFRCSQELCDFADALFPDLPPTISLNESPTDHRGVSVIPRSEVAAYVERWAPTILRDNRSLGTLGFPAINIGVSKGSTFDRVLIFPTKTMLKYVKDRNLAAFASKDRLYVAVTRARHSAVFVDGP